MQQKKRISNFYRIKNQNKKLNDKPYSSSIHKTTASFSKDKIGNDSTYYTSRQKCLSTQRYSNTKQIKPQNQYKLQKFSPKQKIKQRLLIFQQNFKKLLQICSQDYRQLSTLAMRSYKTVKQIFTHYEDSCHAQSYFYQMHAYSTDTKIKLLSMLKEEKRNHAIFDQENDQLKEEQKKLYKLLKCKDQAYAELDNKNKELQEKITHMNNIIQTYEQDQKLLKQSIQQKDQKLQQLQQNKQNLRKQLNTMQHQIQTLNLISSSKSNSSIPLQKQQKSSYRVLGSRSKSPKKIQFRDPCNISGTHPYTYSNTCSRREGTVDDDLYRCLLIQACTIEEQIYQDDDRDREF